MRSLPGRHLHEPVPALSNRRGLLADSAVIRGAGRFRNGLGALKVSGDRLLRDANLDGAPRFEAGQQVRAPAQGAEDVADEELPSDHAMFGG